MSDRLGVDGGGTSTDVLLVEEGSGSARARQDRAVGGGSGPARDDGRDQRAPGGHRRHRDVHPEMTYGVTGAVWVAELFSYRDRFAFNVGGTGGVGERPPARDPDVDNSGAAVVHPLVVLHPSALA
jgi:hypothetical protein